MVKYEELRPDIPEDCPKDFADVIKKCWDTQLGNRPTAGKVLEMLCEGSHDYLNPSSFLGKTKLKYYINVTANIFLKNSRSENNFVSK